MMYDSNNNHEALKIASAFWVQKTDIGIVMIGLNLSQTSPGFHKSFENTVGKGEVARNEQFLLFPQCFLPIWRTFCHFYQI